MAQVDPRRKSVGRRIQRARERAGYASQRVFAEAIGMSEASVANAERGGGRVGNKTYGAIEDKLDWPEGCIRLYLETGDEAALPSVADTAAQADAGAGAEPVAMMSFLVIADRLSPEKLAEFIRVGKKRLPDVRKWYGDEAHDEVALKLMQLAERAGQSFEELLDDSA